MGSAACLAGARALRPTWSLGRRCFPVDSLFFVARILARMSDSKWRRCGDERAISSWRPQMMLLP